MTRNETENFTDLCRSTLQRMLSVRGSAFFASILWRFEPQIVCRIISPKPFTWQSFLLYFRPAKNQGLLVKNRVKFLETQQTKFAIFNYAHTWPCVQIFQIMLEDSRNPWKTWGYSQWTQRKTWPRGTKDTISRRQRKPSNCGRMAQTLTLIKDRMWWPEKGRWHF